MRTVIGLFGNAGEATRAIDELQSLGYPPDRISVVTNVASQDAVQARKSMGLQCLSLADVGQVATGGPLREMLVKQAGDTAALGSALQLFGLTPELADHYVSGVKHGETLESLVVDDTDSDRVLAVMRTRTGSPAPEPEDEETGPLASGGTSVGAATKRTNGQIELDDREEERVIPIVHEEMHVGRRTVERGGVRVSSRIVQRPVSEQVHLRETHVDIERRAVDRPLRGDEKGFVDDAIEIVEMADEPVVSKQARVVEEVVVRKHVEDRTTTIVDQVRATEIEFGELRAFDPDESRSHFESQKIGGTFDTYLPAYRFGHGIHRHRASERWEDVESYAHDRWESDNPGTWDRFRAAIQHAWAHARVS